MGSVSASHLIIFIASLVVAAGVAGTLVTEVDRVSQSITEQSDGMSESIETDIQIISDTGADGIYDDGSDEVTLLVKNVGAVELPAEPERIDLLIEGQFINPDAVEAEVVGDDEVWTPGAVVRIEADTDDVDIDGETRVSVSVNENEATIQFRA
ncbi:fla cluster protein FlaG [Natronomonas pharaonis DSM 2160]|uniref:Fla cluster protein FlaG n=1 Tax=Natronomonas pharaonis (strain ATCC 35678 / DSM 2160 / CIP 103997 / JCM 8858 / NBRC 14720 / NCIMB 2260 / Gabara) TaxID=348780 RepID=A0A1U7EVR7_NATPD|nr:flagellin [Natronomonas pharaonis]CAI49140.1 fla cluster protein FlaG [Natronomonas pharaonis DSM 2160]